METVHLSGTNPHGPTSERRFCGLVGNTGRRKDFTRGERTDVYIFDKKWEKWVSHSSIKGALLSEHSRWVEKHGRGPEERGLGAAILEETAGAAALWSEPSGVSDSSPDASVTADSRHRGQVAERKQDREAGAAGTGPCCRISELPRRLQRGTREGLEQ